MFTRKLLKLQISSLHPDNKYYTPESELHAAIVERAYRDLTLAHSIRGNPLVILSAIKWFQGREKEPYVSFETCIEAIPLCDWTVKTLIDLSMEVEDALNSGNDELSERINFIRRWSRGFTGVYKQKKTEEKT